MSNDQRNNMRLPRACRVTVEITSICPHGTGPSERLSCTTRDLSRSGVNLRLPLELSPGAIHHLEVSYFDDEPPLQLTGEVRWSRPVAGQSGIWDTGLALFQGRDTDMIAWEHLLAVLDRQAV
jgi:hypothetical protein